MLQKLLLFLLFFIVVDSLFSEESIHDFLERSTRDVVIIQDFDDPEGAKGDFANITWSLKSSMYITKTDEKPYPQQARVQAYPSTLNRSFHKEDVDSMRVFAVRAAFNRKGHNYIEFIPHENKEGNALPGIYFDNPILEIGLYVWGSRRDYVLEAEFETTRGTTFVVSFGSLNFQGWKSLKAYIPLRYYRVSDIVQKSSYVIKLNKLVLRTKSSERVDDFLMYFDTLYATETITRLDYDGRELGEKEFIDKIDWTSEDDSSAPTSATESEPQQQSDNQ